MSMARPLGTIDWAVIAVLVIVAALLIYFLRPLVILIAIGVAAYLIYRWYTGRRMIRIS